mgnify:FL=1|jgi:hypothetical protein
MEPIEFKKTILNIAVCAISCDDDIDDREIEAMYNIEKKSPYFSTVDLKETLEKSLKECMKDLNKFQQMVFDDLKKSDLNIGQELTLLEISCIIIEADQRIDDAEIVFIRELRKHLKVDDVIINQRFGDISYLTTKSNEFKVFTKSNEEKKAIKKAK